MTTQYERSAHADGWFRWFGVWLHLRPWEAWECYRPLYFIGTARDLCLAHGLYTGEGPFA